MHSNLIAPSILSFYSPKPHDGHPKLVYKNPLDIQAVDDTNVHMLPSMDTMFEAVHVSAGRALPTVSNLQQNPCTDPTYKPYLPFNKAETQ